MKVSPKKESKRERKQRKMAEEGRDRLVAYPSDLMDEIGYARKSGLSQEWIDWAVKEAGRIRTLRDTEAKLNPSTEKLCEVCGKNPIGDGHASMCDECGKRLDRWAKRHDDAVARQKAPVASSKHYEVFTKGFGNYIIKEKGDYHENGCGSFSYKENIKRELRDHERQWKERHPKVKVSPAAPQADDPKPPEPSAPEAKS